MSRALELPQPITPTEVESWFRSSARRGPWPDEKACEPFARRLEQYRAANARDPVSQEKGTRRTPLAVKGRAFLNELERRIAEVEADIQSTRAFNEEAAVDEELLWFAPLREVHEAMKRSRHIPLVKFVRQAVFRTTGWEHGSYAVSKMLLRIPSIRRVLRRKRITK